MRRKLQLLLVTLLLFCCASLAQQTASRRLRFAVTISPALGNAPVSGRLMVLLSSAPRASGFLSPGFGADATRTWITAREVESVLPGQSVLLDPDELAFPAPFSKAPAGDYYVMAMLDVNHSSAYRFFTPGDLRMKAIALPALSPQSAGTVKLTLDLLVPRRKATPLPPEMQWIDFESPLLSRYYGRPVHMQAIVVLPPSYGSNSSRYPTVYLAHGFGVLPEDMSTMYGKAISSDMADHLAPEMIYVLLNQSLSTGTHEFADSVNNGPWGAALTTELIPYLESRYRMDASAEGRFLTGHSSGGWAALWLQVTYPEVFGGAWATSPDPVDFRNFAGPSIAEAKRGSNLYVKPDGSPWMLVRMSGKDVESFRDYAQQERVVGAYGGQMSSFEWVFSPRGNDGRPLPLFDRVTGNIDPSVAAAWERYDIARILRENWTALGPNLKGKIHIIVGTADTYHLESAVRMLDEELRQLGANAQVRYLPDRTHFDLYDGGLQRRIAEEIYSVARPAAEQRP